ncbi:MAG: carboxypeptidase-like regulatory domain-containing protein [Bryobacteraceae bacterium]
MRGAILKAMVKLSVLLAVIPALHALAEPNILGTVQDRSNAPITGAKVVVFEASGKGVQTTSSAGSFAFDGIADGDYLFKVESIGNKPIFGALRLKASEQQRISIVTVSETSQEPEAVGAGAALRHATVHRDHRPNDRK